MIAYDTVTFWRKRDNTFSRVVMSGVHVEKKRGNTADIVGSNRADTLKAWFFKDPVLRPGDFIVTGVKDGERPPADAFMVRSVNPYSVRFKTHHVEVEAR